MPINPERYPSNWNEISLRIRFERAGGKCEFCGAEHGQPHPVTGSLVVLTTAHLDHRLVNHSDRNLAALCQRCHLNFDREFANNSRRYGKEYQDRQLELPLAFETITPDTTALRQLCQPYPGPLDFTAAGESRAQFQLNLDLYESSTT